MTVRKRENLHFREKQNLECPSDSPEKQKPKLGRKISRVLSIFRKEPKSLSKEPVYEELHEVHDGSEISAPQYSISTMGRLDSGISSGSDQLEPSFAEVLRNGAPFPQVVAPNGWWVRNWSNMSFWSRFRWRPGSTKKGD